MSYIYNDAYEHTYYKPSDDLQNLFQIQVIQPFRETRPDVVSLYDLPNIDEIKRLSENILDRGTTNFSEQSVDKQYGVFTPKDKVSLYCVHYMPMHLFSTYHIFRHYLTPISHNVVFIDFGCGPLTSGIAFWAATSQHNITYIGIDSSTSMCNKAFTINQHGPYRYSSSPFFENVYLITNYQDLPRFMNSIEMGNPDDTHIIFNFSYFLQSYTFSNPANIKHLSEIINLLTSQSEDSKICLVYQDPVVPAFQRRWYALKSFLNFTTQDVPKVATLAYDRLIQGRKHYNVKVSYDIFHKR
ncbi:hypothetical protein F4083_05885 [Candidatus Poribacteria bacterium]|nr:hypothetical protein [Candidatus Poribacteria bacterium]MYF54318.1 hypothetical protein [Candidatus Poribacteria bacterium]MYI93839.1 hypothetical protein [Candidatus Poribacteria bacterium]